MFYYFLKVSSRPQDTRAGLAIAECLYKLGLMRDEVKQIRLSSEGRAAIENKNLITLPTFEYLESLPTETVGHVYFEHMRRENLNPNFFKVLEIKDDETFVMMRLRQTHDLWHVLTGFGTSTADELALQAFSLAQVHSPLSPFLIAGALFATALRRPSEAASLVSSICRGWQMGIQAAPVFAIDWESSWETPLSHLRTKYRIDIRAMTYA